MFDKTKIPPKNPNIEAHLQKYYTQINLVGGPKKVLNALHIINIARPLKKDWTALTLKFMIRLRTVIPSQTILTISGVKLT